MSISKLKDLHNKCLRYWGEYLLTDPRDIKLCGTMRAAYEAYEEQFEEHLDLLIFQASMGTLEEGSTKNAL